MPRAPAQPRPAPVAPTAAAPPTPAAPRPFVKWAGGKTQLLPEIRRRMPESFAGYHEPFLGGGAVFFDVRPPRARLTDLNADLIDCYRAVRDDVEGLIAELTRLAGAGVDRESFHRVRDLDPAGLPPVARAARLIYLNKTCYNGLYRVNRAGRFNVPFGRYKNPTVCDPDNLRACAAALAGQSLEVAPFEQVLSHAAAGDFVYFDPPYQPLSATANFTSYGADGFDEDQQFKLAQTFVKLDRLGCRVMLSNSDSELIHQLYRKYRIERVAARRAINSNPGRRGPVYEVVVRNFG